MSNHCLLNELKARLPELEWHLAKLNNKLPLHQVPKGLFSHPEPTIHHCMTTIYTDIQRMAEMQSELAAYHLAEKIRQKINVLVMICRQTAKPKNPDAFASQIRSLSTRQQWLQSLEANVHILTQQKEALEKSVFKKTTRHDPLLLLTLQAELGAAEKSLVQARETYEQALGQ